MSELKTYLALCSPFTERSKFIGKHRHTHSDGTSVSVKIKVTEQVRFMFIPNFTLFWELQCLANCPRVLGINTVQSEYLPRHLLHHRGQLPWKEKDSVFAAMYHISKSTGCPDNIPEGLTDLCLDFLGCCFVRDWQTRPGAEVC